MAQGTRDRDPLLFSAGKDIWKACGAVSQAHRLQYVLDAPRRFVRRDAVEFQHKANVVGNA